MAENIRVDRDGADPTLRADHDHTLIETETLIPAHPESRSELVSDDPEIARAEIENTRARMSETIDEIEDVLTRKKAEIQDRLDVMAPVREHALPVAGGVFAAGLVLGLLTGGDDDDDRAGYAYDADYDYDYDVDVDVDVDLDYDYDGRRYWAGRASTWETRARRLLDIARDQEEELESLRDPQPGFRARAASALGLHDDDEDDEDDFFDNLRGTVLHAATRFVQDALRNVRR